MMIDDILNQINNNSWSSEIDIRDRVTKADSGSQ
jgi:hypothetical protein